MKLPEHERAAHRAAFRAMTLPQKAEYIFAYYKLPLVLLLVAVVSICSVTRYYLTHKDALIYVGYTNVEIPEAEDERIFTGYLQTRGANPRTTDVYRYTGLYLSDPTGSVDHQYSYASRLKLLAAIDAEELDVVIMDQEAYDLLSHSGYLADLQETLSEADPRLLGRVKELLSTNEVIIEDNQVEVNLGEADAYEAITEKHVNALKADDMAAFRTLDLTGSIYVGVIGNTPRTDEALQLITYLLGD